MKIIHLSDLHLGKNLNGYSLIEDQKDILKKILKVVEDEKAEAVIIAGDVYDKRIPVVEAVNLLDEFLSSLMKIGVSVFIISGNHDSADRIAFGNKIMANSNIYVSPVYDGTVKSVSLNDEYGKINFYLLPFIRPSIVSSFFDNQKIEDYTQAMKIVIDAMNINKDERNVLICHQFVTGAGRCESEENIGGLDNVDASVFDDFDYVALGHIHSPQNIDNERICYCGTPLKYSFSECDQTKSVKIVSLFEKENGKTREEHKRIPLIPLHEMKEIKGTYDQLMAKSFYENLDLHSYYHAILTDENDVENGFRKLNTVYKNLMTIDYENKRTSMGEVFNDEDISDKKSPMDIFEDFFKSQNGVSITEEQKKVLENLIEKIW